MSDALANLRPRTTALPATAQQALAEWLTGHLAGDAVVQLDDVYPTKQPRSALATGTVTRGTVGVGLALLADTLNGTTVVQVRRVIEHQTPLLAKLFGLKDKPPVKKLLHARGGEFGPGTRVALLLLGGPLPAGTRRLRGFRVMPPLG